MCDVTHAACRRFGLVNFVVSSKRLQFLTTGLMSGSYAFIKLFICATVREKRGDNLGVPAPRGGHQRGSEYRVLRVQVDA